MKTKSTFSSAANNIAPPCAGLFAAVSAILLITIFSMTSFSQSGEKWATGCNIVSGNSALGTINNFPLIIKTNNTQQAVFTPFGWFGLGITAPTCILDVNGDGRIINFNIISNLTVGNLLTVKKIVSQTGTVDFDANNITTTAGISGGILNISGTITANTINVSAYTNPAFAGSGNGLVTFNNDGSFQKLNFNNDANTVLYGNGTFGSLPANGWTINGNDMYSIPTGYIGIGTDAPLEKLDVNGNVNIRGYLYVQDGVIIGKRVNSEKVVTDTAKVGQVEIDKGKIDSLASKQITVDSLKTKDIKTEQFTTQKISSVNITTDSLKATQFTLAEMHADSITAVKMTLDKLTTTEIKATV
ncbi:MAG: hypothetical protein HY958_04105, partial [Bacteroidia bacterium]|nr:hypothetical protein [Bacteroidia bacterium]